MKCNLIESFLLQKPVKITQEPKGTNQPTNSKDSNSLEHLEEVVEQI